MTFKILTDDTKKIICRSKVRLAPDGENNLKLDVEAGTVPECVCIKSKRDDDDNVILPAIDASTDPFTFEFDDEEDDDEPEPLETSTPMEIDH